MAVNTYIGIPTVKQCTNFYVGTDNGVKQLKQLYVGTADGTPKLIYTMAFTATFDGTGEIKKLYDEATGNFCWAFTSGGTLTITELGTAMDGIDIFCVAGGENGGSSDWQSWWAGGKVNYYHGKGGNGGQGGATATAKGKTITTGKYVIKVGAANDDEGVSSFGTLCTATGYSAKGGTGGNNTANGEKATNGGDGTYAFGEENFTTPYGTKIKFGAGGGGGFGWNNVGGSFTQGSGGVTGGGDGGATEKDGGDATTPGGGGGGAGGIYNKALGNSEGKNYNKNGGAGKAGIVIIRNHR